MCSCSTSSPFAGANLIAIIARATIDLHCHILAGIDDGARDLEDSVAMALQAQADGIDSVCATPHIRYDHDVHIHELPERINELSDAIQQAGCRTRILPGGEVSVGSLDGLDRDELRAVSLGGGGKWILVEPAPGPLDDGLEDAVEQLRGRGFGAVVAHPERHLGPDLVQRLRRLISGGALVQATAAYFTDESRSGGMLALATAGVIHVLGSDAHSSRAGRPVALSPALDPLRTVRPPALHLDWIVRTAPDAIIHGQEIRRPF